eukprot:TRINITY_DN7168_c0_g1_i10.p1 TRINITY_DN7168_c0_g1~~TRINITY_DN7168_c0_g1_i10.p1  ORF type:complete len:206 (+),score=19.16 TRINITY_DN7168_c0_g1_i10:165-782(+)
MRWAAHDLDLRVLAVTDFRDLVTGRVPLDAVQFWRRETKAQAWSFYVHEFMKDWRELCQQPSVSHALALISWYIFVPWYAMCALFHMLFPLLCVLLFREHTPVVLWILSCIYFAALTAMLVLLPHVLRFIHLHANMVPSLSLRTMRMMDYMRWYYKHCCDSNDMTVIVRESPLPLDLINVIMLYITPGDEDMLLDYLDRIQYPTD